jgi:hypothetical protein
VSRRHHGGRPHRPGGHLRALEPHHGPGLVAPPEHAASNPTPPALTVPAPPANGHLAASGDPAPGEAPLVIAPLPVAEANGAAPGCTAPQLRRFIKSRPYVPMHELRRRFGINGGEDDVTVVELGSGRIYVGLPHREGLLLGELLRGGEIGYELSLDPRSPVVVGLYPMRPVARV